MTDYVAAGRNLGLRALRRLASAYKPIVRRARRRARAAEQFGFAQEAAAADAVIARVAGGSAPIVAGPWLAEVGYEVLYWVPFLRWFVDTYRIDPARMTVISRGGAHAWYAGIARHYVDIFDLIGPDELGRQNESRMSAEEGGGRKQSSLSSLDRDLLGRGGMPPDAHVLHPSVMFRLFRHVWHGNLPLDLLWTHTDYGLLPRPPVPGVVGLPSEYIAAKFYSGTALPDRPEHRAAVKSIIRQAATVAPVVSLDAGLAVDEHEDYGFADVPGVISARQWMEPKTNLGVQTAVAAHARLFLGTCGGLAWMTPFLGVPTVAVYADDRQLAPHLFVARQAGRRVRAADFALLDVRVQAYLGEDAIG